jgi:hypothetical protein
LPKYLKMKIVKYLCHPGLDVPWKLPQLFYFKALFFSFRIIGVLFINKSRVSPFRSCFSIQMSNLVNVGNILSHNGDFY